MSLAMAMHPARWPNVTGSGWLTNRGAVGRAEVALGLTASGKSFRSDWALPTSQKVVARAEALFGN